MPRHPELLEHGGRRVGAGRHPLLNSRQLHQPKKLLAESAGLPTDIILERVNKKFHCVMQPRTYRKYAALVDAPYVRIPTRPKLNVIIRAKRVRFARNHRSIRGLFDTIAADETAFETVPSVAYGRVPRGFGITRQRNAHPLKINVWWAASGRHVAEPVFYTKPLTGQRYAAILRRNLRPLLLRCQNRCRLIQDNLRAHYTPECRQFYATERVTVMEDFPPNSPDIQPIENWWAIAKAEVNRSAPTTRAELEAAVRRGLKKVTSAVRQATLRSLPGRLKFIREHNGDYSGH